MANSIYNPYPRVFTLSPVTDSGVFFYIAVIDIPNSMIIDSTSSISAMTLDPNQSGALMASLQNMNPFPSDGTTIDPAETTTFLLPMLTSDTENYDNNRIWYDNINIYDSENAVRRGKITKDNFRELPEIPTSEQEQMICNELFNWRAFVLANLSNTEQFFVGGLYLNNAAPYSCPYCNWGSNGVWGSFFAKTNGGNDANGAYGLYVTLAPVDKAPPLLTIGGVVSATNGQYTFITRAEPGQGTSMDTFDYDNPFGSL
jgi:hypothetical protein